MQARLPGPRGVHVPLWASSRHDVNNRPRGGSGASAWSSFIFGGPLFDKSCHELRVGAQDVEDLLLLMRRAGRAQSPEQLLERRLGDVSTRRNHSRGSRSCACLHSALLLRYIHQGSLALTLLLLLLVVLLLLLNHLLLLLRCHHTRMSHLVH